MEKVAVQWLDIKLAGFEESRKGVFAHGPNADALASANPQILDRILRCRIKSSALIAQTTSADNGINTNQLVM
jgi:hypothetical protein